ncbi:MAG: hypothetical protein EOM20_08355 [Spartobacteria bacterium]|nr:hypothetical protein [Spartobacteria bacterium]
MNTNLHECFFEPRNTRSFEGVLHFSNGWKKHSKSFQWLENSAKKFPMIGKIAKKVSNDWKFLKRLYSGPNEPFLLCFPCVPWLTATASNDECLVPIADRRRQRLEQGDSKESSDWQLISTHLSSFITHNSPKAIAAYVLLKEIQR